MVPIYLDHNATTPVLPEVVEAMLPYLREHFGNPSSGHPYGRRAHDAVEAARAKVAAALHCAPAEVFFTSGGTEANNLALCGAFEANPGRRALVTSAIEHPATLAPCRWLESKGATLTVVGVDGEGRARLDEVERAVGAQTLLLSLMHANNETGVLQPVTEASRLARRFGALVHCDAAQSLGKVKVDVEALGVDLLSVAGHKLYAPKGVGALYVRNGVPLAPFARGAGHERGLRPGTENVASIVGLGVACEWVQSDLEAAAARMAGLRDRLEAALRQGIPELQLNGHREQRLPNTSSVRFPRVEGTALLAGAPELAASTGSACHDGHESASAVILAMGVAPAEAGGTVRLTLGRGTSEADVDTASAALVRAWRALVR
jgi:cysteine desulfurase